MGEGYGLAQAAGWSRAQINEVSEKIRNDTLEEVAKEFDKMNHLATRLKALPLM